MNNGVVDTLSVLGGFTMTEVPLSLLGAIPDLFVSSVEREIERVREATRSAFDSAFWRRVTRPSENTLAEKTLF